MALCFTYRVKQKGKLDKTKELKTEVEKQKLENTLKKQMKEEKRKAENRDRQDPT